MRCGLCNGALLEAGNTRCHTACENEWSRRYNANKCGQCGKRDKTENRFACNECANSNVPFVGYPPGGK